MAHGTIKHRGSDASRGRGASKRSPSAAAAGSQSKEKQSVKAKPPARGAAQAAAVSASDDAPRQLSTGEVSVLTLFRKYLMTPGRMLCLNHAEVGSMKRSLDKLIAAGMLVPESFKGSYSLTRSGFQAMNELE